MPKLDEILANRAQYPDDQTLTYSDGSTVTLGELRGGYLRTSDYTRKTQELAAERRRFDEERASNDAAIAQAREDLVKLASQATAHPADTSLTSEDQIDKMLREDPAARRLLAKVEAAEKKAEAIELQWRQAQEGAQRHRAEQLRQYHESTIAQLQAKDPSLDRDALTTYALHHGIARLDKAYELMTESTRWAEREKAIRDEEHAKAKLEVERQQAVLPTRRSFAPPALGKDEPKTFDEAARAAESDPEIQALMWGQIPG